MAIAYHAGRAPAKAAASGRDYLLRFALPNFYFHVTTAYDILRQRGVALGKPDFLGELPASAPPDEARPG